MTFRSVNPATEETLQTFEPLDEPGLEAALAGSTQAWRRHRRTSLADRADRLRDAAELLERGA